MSISTYEHKRVLNTLRFWYSNYQKDMQYADEHIADVDKKNARIEFCKRQMAELSFIADVINRQDKIEYGQPLWELGHVPASDECTYYSRISCGL